MDSTFIQNPCANKENIKTERLGLMSPVPQKKHKAEEENSNPLSISETQEIAAERENFNKSRALSFHNPTNSAFRYFPPHSLIVRYILSHSGPKFSQRDQNIPESTVKTATLGSSTALLHKSKMGQVM